MNDGRVYPRPRRMSVTASRCESGDQQVGVEARAQPRLLVVGVRESRALQDERNHSMCLESREHAVQLPDFYLVQDRFSTKVIVDPASCARRRDDRPDAHERRQSGDSRSSPVDTSVTLHGGWRTESSAGRPSEKRSEEDLPRRRMLQQRDNQLPMAVERRRSANDRHDAVGPGQLEETFDVLVGHSLSQRPKRQLCVELVLQDEHASAARIPPVGPRERSPSDSASINTSAASDALTRL